MKNLLIHSTEYSKIFTTLSYVIYNLYLKVTIPLSKSYLRNAKYSQGFSMVESLVAIAVLLIAIVGPLTIAINSIQYSNVAKDKLQATYLAQEQLELMVARQHSIFIECYIGVPALDINTGTTYNATRQNCTDTKDNVVNNNAIAAQNNSSVVSVDLEVKGQAFKEFYNELYANNCFTADGCYIDFDTLNAYNFEPTNTASYNYDQVSICQLYNHDSNSSTTNNLPLFLCNKDSLTGWAKSKFDKKLTASIVTNVISNNDDFNTGLNNINNPVINKQDQILLTSAVTYTIFGIPRTVKLELLVSMLQ